jgi:two-component system sensor histidine kinase RstB
MGRSFNAMADRVELMIGNQKELLAGISHELRSPLSRMKLSLEMLREAGAQRARVDAVDAEVDALDALVQELLVVSQLELATASLELGTIAVHDLIEEGWKRVAAVAKETRLQIDVQPDAGELRVDRVLAVRILGNLFENAVRHGGGELVKVTARRQEDRIVLAVSDNGPGVPAEVMESLFEPFFRVDRSRSRRTGGTGIGLMIVRRAVEAHGGKVRAEAAPGGGLALIFDLPATQV